MTPATSGMVAYAIPPSANSPPTVSSNERPPRRRSPFIANSPWITENLRGGVSPIRPRSRPLTKSSLPGEPGKRRAFGPPAIIPQCFCHVFVMAIGISAASGKRQTTERVGGKNASDQGTFAAAITRIRLAAMGFRSRLSSALRYLSLGGDRCQHDGGVHVQR